MRPDQTLVQQDLAKTCLRRIPLRALKRMPMPVSALPKQRGVLAWPDDLQATVDQLKALQAQTGAELDALLLSILDKAFEGEL
jgi:hypothetical protein